MNLKNQTYRIVSFFFLAGIGMSFPLWLPVRSIPLLPIVNIPVAISEYLSWATLCILVLSLAIRVIVSSRLASLFILISVSILLIQDQLRWQPWVYLYLLLLLPSLIEKEEGSVIGTNYFRVTIIAIYLWSGIHKLNTDFIESAGFQILEFFLFFVSTSTLKQYLWIGYFIPIIEIILGCFLYSSKTRQMGCYLAIIVHSLIIFYLSPLGTDYNLVVIPWNVAMIVLILSLFSPFKYIINLPVNTLRHKLAHAMLLLSVCILPLMNFIGFWDHYLSFSLYSGKTPVFYVASEYHSFGGFNDTVEPHLLRTDSSKSVSYLNINQWSLQELHVPFYPEERVFKQLSSHFCMTDPNPDKLLFVIGGTSLSEENLIAFRCK